MTERKSHSRSYLRKETSLYGPLRTIEPPVLIIGTFGFEEETTNTLKFLNSGTVFAYILPFTLIQKANDWAQFHGLKQCRFLMTRFADSKSIYTFTCVKKGKPTFNEKYHDGLLNYRPNDPRPDTFQEGGVERTYVKLNNIDQAAKYTTAELISIYSNPGDTISVSDKLFNPGKEVLDIIYRTPHPKKNVLK